MISIRCLNQLEPPDDLSPADRRELELFAAYCAARARFGPAEAYELIYGEIVAEPAGDA